MAGQKVVPLKIELDGNEANKTVGNFKTQLREANQELVEMAERFGSSSKEAIEAAKRVAQLKDAIGDAKDLADAFSPDRKFDAFSKSIQGVVGGFAGLQGAMGLFGSESEGVQKALLKVQSAMALSEGLNSVLSAKDAFTNLGTIIKGNVVKAFGTLRGAIISTGVGALVVGVGLLIANFDTVKEKVLNLFPGLGKLAGFIGKLVTGFTDFVGITSQAERGLDALKKSNERLNENIANQIKVLQAQGGAFEDIQKLKKKSVENDLSTLREKLKVTGKLSEDELKQFRSLKTDLSVIDAETRKKQDDDRKEEQKKQEQRNKEEAEKRKQLAEKRREDLKKELDAQNHLEEETKRRMYETRKRLIDADFQLAEDEAKAKAEQQARFDKMMEERQTNRMDLTGDLTPEQMQDRAMLLQSLLYSETEIKMQALDDEYQRRFQLISGNEEAELNLKKWYSDQKRQIDFAETEARLNLYDAIGQGLGTLGGLFEKSTAAAKIAALADIAIGTGTGFIRALEIAQKSAAGTGPFAAFAFPVFYATQIAAVLGAAAKAKSILGTAPGGGNSAPSIGTTSAPIAPQTATPTNTRIDQAQVNQIANAAVRAYVVESDMTTNQEKVRQLNRRARID